ncbi:MAG: plasmid pRiA4b ORF-3 family protein [bacterium]
MKKSVDKPSIVSKQIYQLKITLVGSRPKIWRRVLVPASIKLGSLHQVIQTAMGWHDGHLHIFEIAGAYYSYPHPDTDWEDTGDVDYRRITLKKVAPAAKAKFSYLYDFGDGWEHEIVVEKIIEGGPSPLTAVCVSGERACPPEDVGGLWGYAEFLKIMGTPKHAEHAHWLDWYGGPFDPEAFDVAAVNKKLAAVC